ncbi:MAG: NADPH-dependent FMN reductase [Candidatus Amoebophilus sp. 36-38]|nr:MAG: NADPH-dependent FMN reductase [Candidatus Amoebophilus sp. 36-38]
MTDQSILIIAGTNRNNSLSSATAHHYAQILEKKGASAQVLELTSLPPDFTATALYQNMGKNKEFNLLAAQVEQAQKYVFIVPEYNRSFPGVLKAFIDGLSPRIFTGKRCALVGLSQGMHGGSFALGHLTDIFHYFRMHVYPLKPTLGNITDSRLETVLANSRYIKLLEEQAEGIIKY